MAAVIFVLFASTRVFVNYLAFPQRRTLYSYIPIFLYNGRLRFLSSLSRRSVYEIATRSHLPTS